MYMPGHRNVSTMTMMTMTFSYRGFMAQVLVLGMLSCSMLVGDGVITPPNSVLGALKPGWRHGRFGWKWWWKVGWNGVPPMISGNVHYFPLVGNDDRFISILETAGNRTKYPEISSISTTSWHHFNSWSSKRVGRCFVDPSGSCNCWPNFLKITVSEGMPELAADVSSSSNSPTVVETCWNNGSLHGQKRTKNSPSNLKSLNRGPQNELA